GLATTGWPLRAGRNRSCPRVAAPCIGPGRSRPPLAGSLAMASHLCLLAFLQLWGTIVPRCWVALLGPVAIGAFLARAPAEEPAAGVPLAA
ncbi:hypothetical protein BHM03_00060088, partial [Ensete ventricosum]